jgi:hypothetical protein
VSGSRLTAVGVADLHGNSGLAWFYDTELDVRCSLGTAGDGELRCVPEGPDVVALGGVFSDASCTEVPLMISTTCENDPPAYILRPDGPNGGRNAYEVTEQVSPLYGINTRGTCSTYATAQPAYAGSLVAPSSLVGFTRSVQSRSAVLGQVLYTGSDGSTVAGPIWDIARDEPVMLFTAEGTSDVRAVPVQDDVHYQQLDRGSCASQSNNAFVTTPRDPEPSFIVYRADAFDEHGNHFGQYSEVRAITGTSTTTCVNNVEVSLGDGYIAYILDTTGADVTQFPVVEYRWDEGDGLRMRHVTHGGTAIAPWPAGNTPLLRLDGEPLTVTFYDDELVGFTRPTWTSTVYANGCSNPVVEASEAVAGDWVTQSARDLDQCFHRPGGPDTLLDLWQTTTYAASTNLFYVDWQGFCQHGGLTSGWRTEAVTAPVFDVTFTD